MGSLKKAFIYLFALIASCFFNSFVSATEKLKTQQLDSLILESEIAQTNQKKIALLLKASQIAYDLNKYEKALLNAKNANKWAIQENQPKDQVLAMILESRIYRKLDNNTKAFESALKAKDLADRNSFSKEASNASVILAAILFFRGEYDKSSEFAFNSIDELEKNKDYNDLCFALNIIGLSYHVNHNDSLAIIYLNQAINIGKKHKCYKELGVAVANMAAIYGNIGDYNKAFYYQKQACSILLNHTKNLSGIGVSYTNIALSFLHINEPDSAYYYLNKSLEHNKAINNLRNIIITNNGFAQFYRYTHNNEKFLEFIYKAYNLAQANNYKTSQLEAAEMLESFYLENSRFDSAYKYKCIQSDIEQNISSQNTLTKLSQLQMMKDIELAEKEHKLETQRKNFITTISFLSFISAVIIVIILVLRYKLKVRYFNLEKEKLNNDLHFKSQEMIDSTITLIRKNELLSNISQQLLDIINKNHGNPLNKELGRLVKELQSNHNKKTWKEFDIRFKQIHAQFYDNLIAQYPDMSPNDLKICAFLRLNLSTKEISELTGLQIRSIENARTRIRKKLGINSTKENLVTFLLKI